MAYDQRDNSGVMFANDRKEKDTHPDRTGNAMIDGRKYWVSGWIKQDRNGKPFLSLAFKPQDQAEGARQERSQPAQEQAVAPTRRSMKDEMDDEIPF
jgi:hypothetical protein